MTVAAYAAAGAAQAQPGAGTAKPDVSPLQAFTLAAYRYLHENPETGKNEHAAKRYIADALVKVGGFQLVPVPDLPTAVIAVLDTGRRGATIALRAELDARPLDEGQNEPESHDPRSQIAGVMHNCGHDAHAAMLLGAARHIAEKRRHFRGRIVFVFQPAEETAGGADDIVASGVLQNLGVEAIFAQHCAPKMPVGRIQLVKGTPLAGSTGFNLLLRGQESHAALPSAGSDLTLVAARFIAELTTLPARRLDIANRPVVVSVTQMSSNAQTRNGLPSEVELRGTIRAFENIDTPPDGLPSIGGILRQRIADLSLANGVEAIFTPIRGSPPTRNDDMLFDLSYPALKRVWGADLTSPVWRGMFSEDFAFFGEAFPALYFSLGISRHGLGEADSHSRNFTIHPDALVVGTSFLVSLARDVGPLLPAR